MKLLALTLLAGAALAADNEVEGLLFGVSHHFQNRDQYQYREANPGVGLSYWRSIGENVAVGVSVASYRNSYDMNSMALVPGAKYEKTDGAFSYGVITGLGSVSGYDTERLCPHLSGFMGWERVKLHAAYLPYKQGCDQARPASSALVAWIGISIVKW